MLFRIAAWALTVALALAPSPSLAQKPNPTLSATRQPKGVRIVSTSDPSGSVLLPWGTTRMEAQAKAGELRCSTLDVAICTGAIADFGTFARPVTLVLKDERLDSYVIEFPAEAYDMFVETLTESLGRGTRTHLSPVRNALGIKHENEMTTWFFPKVLVMVTKRSGGVTTGRMAVSRTDRLEKSPRARAPF